MTPSKCNRASQAAVGVVLSAAILDRYVGEYKHVAAGTMVTFRRDGDKLLVKVQGSGRPEMSFVARSETRFVSAPIFALEFQLDGQGKVTGATWELGSMSIPLERNVGRAEMMSIMRLGLGAFAGAAALALSLATVAHAQQAQQAQPDTAPMTEAQTAGVKRVKEMIEALNSGDYATIRAYFDAQSDPNGFANALGRYHLSRGYDLLRVETRT